MVSFLSVWSTCQNIGPVVSLRRGQATDVAVLILAIFAFLVASPEVAQAQRASADTAASTASVRGFVRDAADGALLRGANVVIQPFLAEADSAALEEAVATNADGFYRLAGLPAGRYVLRVSFVGYRSHRDTLRLSTGDRRTLTISLNRTPRRLAEVTVEGNRPVSTSEAGLERISSADIRTTPVPGPGSDLASFLRSLPSVATTGDRGGRLYVRGGTPAQNLILVDGVPLTKPFHIVGLYSALPGALVSSANFYAGGFGAEYTGSISSVLDVRLRPGNTQEFAASAGAGPFIASARFEGPIQPGASSFLVNVRHSLVERSAPALFGEDAPYRFYDVTVKGHTRGSSSQCSFTGMRTYDRGRIDPDAASAFRWTNTALGGRCLLFGTSSDQALDVRFGTSSYGNDVQSADGTLRSAGTWRIYTAFDLSQPVDWAETVDWSVKVRADRYTFDLEEPFLGRRGDEDLLITGSLHGGFTWSWNDALTVRPSLGVQVPFSWGSTTIEPRLRLSARPGGPGTPKLTASGGLYRQLSTGITDERDAGSAFQALLPTPFEDQPLSAAHLLVGASQRVADPLVLSVEGWGKRMSNLPVPRWTSVVRFNTSLTRAKALAYGVDVSARYKRGPLRVDLSYGYSRTTYEAGRDALGAWTGGEVVEYSPPHDLRHQLSVRAQADLGVLTSNLSWTFASGRPFTQVFGYDTLQELRALRDDPLEDVGVPRAFYNRPYGGRLPSTHRLDVSIRRQFELRSGLLIQAEAGAINAYDRANVFYVDIFTLDRVDQLPFLPYLSLTVKVN